MNMTPRTNKTIEELTDKFLRWPLPESVCADLCATKQSKGRVGTNLLSYTEAHAMLQDVVQPALIETAAKIEELKSQRENMCVFITRLCRQSYNLGLRNKLTDSAMDYINKTDAEKTPASKILRKVLATPPARNAGSARG